MCLCDKCQNVLCWSKHLWTCVTSWSEVPFWEVLEFILVTPRENIHHSIAGAVGSEKGPYIIYKNKILVCINLEKNLQELIHYLRASKSARNTKKIDFLESLPIFNFCPEMNKKAYIFFIFHTRFHGNHNFLSLVF